eukprot:TRINITY_DN100598_c0_g1_i1.p1 TRINITY_DN100598_c0_g1~~TRINITY_DN100598_c0_g1_i1.p1  ORF type:complete len:401 (-),score=71.06 TRINITY_DN100598_c0_g1_i1:571-1704(-)
MAALQLPAGAFRQDPVKLDTPAWAQSDAGEEGVARCSSLQMAIDGGGEGQEGPEVDCTSPAKLLRRSRRAKTEPATTLLPPPGLEGLEPSGDLPSRGSVYHATGECRPCSWFWKPTGCLNGYDCGHCHACPQGEIKQRKKHRTAMLRLGLTTPKTVSRRQEPANHMPFGMQEDLEQMVDSAQDHDESTTCSGSEAENGLTASTPGVVQGPRCFEPVTIAAREFLAAPAVIALKATDNPGSSPLASEQSPRMTSAGSGQGAARLAPVKLQFGIEARIEVLPAEEDTSAVDPMKEATEERTEAMQLDSDNTLPSKGSALHGTGQCRPCAWFWKADGCHNDKDCLHCHLCPEGELKARKKTRHAVIRQSLHAAQAAPAHS